MAVAVSQIKNVINDMKNCDINFLSRGISMPYSKFKELYPENRKLPKDFTDLVLKTIQECVICLSTKGKELIKQIENPNVEIHTIFDEIDDNNLEQIAQIINDKQTPVKEHVIVLPKVKYTNLNNVTLSEEEASRLEYLNAIYARYNGPDYLNGALSEEVARESIPFPDGTLLEYLINNDVMKFIHPNDIINLDDETQISGRDFICKHVVFGLRNGVDFKTTIRRYSSDYYNKVIENNIHQSR